MVKLIKPLHKAIRGNEDKKAFSAHHERLKKFIEDKRLLLRRLANAKDDFPSLRRFLRFSSFSVNQNVFNFFYV